MKPIKLCHIDDIADDSAKGFELEGRNVFVVKKMGKIYAYHNVCPHLGVNLEWQPDQFLDADAQLIQCSTHGALFLIESGECIAGPCSGRHLEPANIELKDEGIYLSP